MRVETPEGVIELGTTEANPTIGIIDYSRRVTDDFGVTTVVERGFARRMSVRLAVPFDGVDALQRTLAGLRATSALWVADDDFASLTVQGFYKDFSLDLAVPPLSYCTLTVEGVAETGGAVDLSVDPAPDGQASTLRLLQPATITDAALVVSSVAEADHAQWTAGSYALGARVIKAHRIWESLVAANIADPSALSDSWLNVGPTNRWAMFDQALGTITTAATSITVTLAAGAVDAVALLDVVAATVRVQSPGYDQTVAVGGGAVTFLNLPLTSGQVTVTISGSGQVSVGTLLLGRLVALGITEASPTAGITDFSRKDVDDFGEVTIVQRAWAKRMTANALIRTDAVDVVADRIAAVRARPSLWIGETGLDSLTIYGFFKDFSIEVGENVSRLSLSIEGLSKAPPVRTPISETVAEIEARLAAEANPDILTPTKKVALIATVGALEKRWIDAHAAFLAAYASAPGGALPGDDPRVLLNGAANTRRTELYAFLGAILPDGDSWNDTGLTSAVDHDALNVALGAFDTALSSFAVEMRLVYPDGTPINDLQPASPGATPGSPDGSTIGGTLNPDTGAVTGGIPAQNIASEYASFADDGILKRAEKQALIDIVAIQEARWQGLLVRAVLFPGDTAVVDARTFALGKRSAWLLFLDAITPPWDDTASNSPVDRVGYRATLSDFVGSLELLEAALANAERGTRTFFTDAEPPTAGVRLGDVWRKANGEERTWYGAGTVGELQLGDDLMLLGGGTFYLGAGGGWLLTATSREIAGKARTFYTYAAGDPAPVATSVGDLWYEAPIGVWWRWSGAAWERTADRTDLNSVTFPQLPEIKVFANYLGEPLAGQLPRIVYPKIYKGGFDRTADAVWSCEPGAYSITVTNTPGAVDNGKTTLSGTTISSGSFKLIAQLDGSQHEQIVLVNRVDNSVPEGSGAGAGSPATDDTLEPIGGLTNHVPISSVLAVTVGASGQVELVINAAFSANSPGFEAEASSAEPVPEVNVSGKWKLSANGETGWVDTSIEIQCTVTGFGYLDLRPGSKGYHERDGSLLVDEIFGGLTEGVWYFQAFARIYAGPVGGQVSSWLGFASARPL